MPGTDAAHAATSVIKFLVLMERTLVGLCYAVPGADVAYAATRHHSTEAQRVGGSGVSGAPISLRPYYTSSGTDVVLDTTVPGPC